MLSKAVRAIVHEEDGAVTVDWVVLTAALAGLGLAVLIALQGAISEGRESISTRTVAAATHDWTFTISTGAAEPE